MKNHKKEELKKWENMLKNVFGDVVPENAVWTEINAIVEVLNIVATDDSLNHMFLPGGGGDHLKQTLKIVDDKYVEINFSLSPAIIIKPKRLVFQSFSGENGHQWSYFVLELAALDAIDRTEGKSYEYVCELTSGNFIRNEFYEEGYYNGKPLPDNARQIIRFLQGSFALFSNASAYNNFRGQLDAYRDHHSKLGTKGFKKFIETLIERKKIINPLN